VTTITYCDTHFRCAECDSEWVNEYDTYEQRSVLKRAVAEES
jgi:transposase-like protein